ncbi:hypothetical protein [Halorussus pelagicus]|uniref:hypothetical protein n=1 Tax=Halorussus pelagicus TaxID=2505977 RepID=UPI000FFBDB66|nr:hypothetical protein [Halorussus pelagicus]
MKEEQSSESSTRASQLNEQGSTDATRRDILSKIGSTSIGIGAIIGGFSSSSTIASAHHNGSPWSDDYGILATRDTVSRGHQVKDLSFNLKYQGYDDEGSLISHHFGFALSSHTYGGQKNCSYCEVTKDYGHHAQEGSRFLIDNVKGGTENMNIDSTYPGYVTNNTDPTWEEVIKQSGDSIETYKGEVVDTVYNNSNKGYDFAGFIGQLAFEAMKATVSSVGNALTLAKLLFKLYDDPNFCGENTITGNPSGFKWDFCNGGNIVVPLQWQHGKVEIKVPNDGDVHRVGLTQEALFSDSVGSYGANDETALRWKLDLPGRNESASLAGKEAKLASEVKD